MEKQYGKNAAGEFVKMVADIKVLSATDFLLSFYELEERGWKYNDKESTKKNGLYFDGKDDEKVRESALSTVMQVVGQENSKDETNIIRNWFLTRHGVTPKEGKKYSIHGYVLE